MSGCCSSIIATEASLRRSHELSPSLAVPILILYDITLMVEFLPEQELIAGIRSIKEMTASSSEVLFIIQVFRLVQI